MENGVIFGIDIAKGSSRARELPKYALSILSDGQITHHSMLRRHKILRMVQSYHPVYIAVDNIFELAANKKELIHFLEKLPADTKLVQVTGGVHQRPLLRLAQEHGLRMNPLDPNDEAEACAILASFGVGCEVSLFEDITRIKVSRARSLGRGGWSQNRYRRKVHGAVREKSREIEHILRDFSKESGFSFDNKVTEGFGGYVRAEYTVHARRALVPIKSSANADAQVTVRSVQRDKIKYISLKKTGRRYTIVGIDPGTTVGIAILSLDGDLLLSKSSRGISHDEVVRLIAEYGKPAIIATDVHPTPAAVEKIRRSFNAVIGTPGGEIKSEDKIALARPFGYSNDHERDSLAAALTTYRYYRNIFSRVEKKTPKYLDIDKVKFHVINGDSIDEAIDKVSSTSHVKKVVKQEVKVEDEVDVDDQVRKLRDELYFKNSQTKKLREYVSELKAEFRKKEDSIGRLEAKMKRIKSSVFADLKKDKEIRIRDNEIERLRKELRKSRKSLQKQRSQNKRLKQIRKKEMKGEGLPVKIISSFARSAIQHTNDIYGIKEGDIIYLETSSGGGPITASILVEFGIKAVIIHDEMPHAALDFFNDANIPVIRSLDIQRQGDFAIVAPEKLDVEITKWLRENEDRLREKEHKQFKNILDEYRSERRRGLV